MGQSGDVKRRESLSTSGGWMENAIEEAWGIRNMTEEEGRGDGL